MIKRAWMRAIFVITCFFVFNTAWAGVPGKPSRVYSLGKHLILEHRSDDGSADGKLDAPEAYIIKGVNWSPATISPDEGPNPFDDPLHENVPYGFFLGHRCLFDYWLKKEIQDYSQPNKDIKLMEEMNVNTVRVYSDFGEDPLVYNPILDEFYDKNIKVIMIVAGSREDLDKDRFDVYTDYNAPYNHFFPSGFMGDISALQINENNGDAGQPFSGPSCIQIKYDASSSTVNGWAGIYWQSYSNNWGAYPGLDLQGFNKLVFNAKGKEGGEIINVKIGGITGDSDSIAYGPPITLTNIWQAYTVNLTGRDLSSIRGGFSVTFDIAGGTRTIYLDDIYYTYDTVLGGPRRKAKYEKIVELYKNHPAILMWSLGNEWNLETNKYYGYSTVTEAALATEQAANEIKVLDSNHPVSSCLGDRFEDPNPLNTIAYILSVCPDVDVWGLNIYRGASFGVSPNDLFTQWQTLTSKPFYISEFGTDSFNTTSVETDPNGIQMVEGDEDQGMQSDFVIGLWEELRGHLSALDTLQTEQCAGGLVFEFNDELWKVGSPYSRLYKTIEPGGKSYKEYNPQGFLFPGHPDVLSFANEEYFGIVNADRSEKSIFGELLRCYSDIPAGNHLPEMTSVVLLPIPAYTNTDVTATPSATDADSGDTITYKYQWKKNGNDITGEINKVLLSSEFNKKDEISVEVTPNDGKADGLPMSSAGLEISNSVPTQPSVSLTQPPYDSSDIVATVSGSSDADNEDVIAYKYAWYKDGVLQLGLTTNTVAATLTGVNEVWRCEVTPNDGTADGPSGASSTTIVADLNHLPEMTSVVLSPIPAYTNTDVTATPSATDADGDTITYSYQWNKNGVIVEGETNSILPSSKFEKADMISVEVTPNDGKADGLPMSSADLEISNSVPTQPSVSLTQPPYDASDIVATVSGSSDADNDDVIAYNYAWYKDGVLQLGLTTNTVAATLTGVNEVWRCEVTPNDGTADGLKGESSVEIVVDLDTTAPAAITDLSASNPSVDAVTLTWTAPGDDGAIGTAASYDIRYSSVNITAANWANATPATGEPAPKAAGETESFVVSGLSSNTTYYFAIKAADEVPNISGLSGVASAKTLAVNTAPEMQAVTITPVEAYTNTVLTANATATDAENDPITYKYQWKNKNGDIEGATDSTLSGSEFNKGEEISVVVTPNDGKADGLPLSSAGLTVLNSLPTQPSVSLTQPPYDASDIVATVSGSSDADNDDVITYNYAWYKNTLPQPGLTTNTVAATHTEVGDVWKCEVTPNDGTDYGPIGASSTTIVADLNHLPEMTSVVLSPIPAYTNTDVTATPSATDADGDTITYKYQWKKNGNDITGEINKVLLSSEFNKKDVISVEVTPNDGKVDGSPLSSAGLTVLNSVPTQPSVSLTDPAYDSSDIVAAVSGSTDEDNEDVITYKYAWYKDDDLQDGLTGDTVVATLTGVGEKWRCEVTPNDGTDYGPIGASSTTIVADLNHLPEMTSVVLSPIPAYTNTDVTATPSATDADSGDTITYSYQWKKNGVIVEGETDSILPSSKFEKADVINAVVTPNDGKADGLPLSSADLEISNTVPTPPPPTGLTSYANSGKVGLVWNVVDGAVSYNIYRQDMGTAPIGASITTVYIDYKVVDGITYTYTVTALNNSGKESVKSTPVSATPTRERKRR